MDDNKNITLYSQFVKVGLNMQIYSDDNEIQSNCNSIYFRNQGDSNVLLAGKIVLFPFQDITIDSHAGEFFTYLFAFAFTGGTTNNLLVIWKNP